nr:hypothetical protein BaRGS_005150 [Batillaria attramentaria]
MDPFDPLFTLADDDDNTTSTSTSTTVTGSSASASVSAQQDLMDIFGGDDFTSSSDPGPAPLVPTSEDIPKADVDLFGMVAVDEGGGDGGGGGVADGGGGGGGGDVIADGDGAVNGVTKTADPLDDLFGVSPTPLRSADTKTCKSTESSSADGDLVLDLGGATESTGETTSEADTWDLLEDMDEAETQGGPTVTLDDFFGISSPQDDQSNTGGVTCKAATSETLTVDDLFGSGQNGDAGHDVEKEGSPEIVVDAVDAEENVALKDATSEKALLGNAEPETSGDLLANGDSSKTEEEKRKSSSDIDMDFAVLELDSSHLNLDVSKQKTSLRKRGSLARRKKPTRATVLNSGSDTTDSIFQDSTEPKATSPSAENGPEDEVFDKRTTDAEPPSERQEESSPVRRSALPFKPPMVMPGLQDLSKSKLFNQERKKSGNSPTSPIKSPVTSPTSPNRAPPPTILPKPTTKGQKDSQNLKVAAENSSSPSSFSADSSSVAPARDVNVDIFSVSADTSGLAEVKRSDRTSSSSSLGDSKAARGDGVSSLGGTKPRTESWSSVSSSAKLSRGDSTSSVEGDGSTTTPRRGSIQGSAYAPMGFRPRRSSSSVLDTSGRLSDSSALASPSSPSLVKGENADSSSPLSVPGSASKLPARPKPVWLSEMKTKTGGGGDLNLSARLRTTSGGSGDKPADSSTGVSSREGADVVGGTGDHETSPSVSSSGFAGVSLRSTSEELSQKRLQDQKPEKPVWMKAAQEKTSRVADRLQSKAGGQENGDGDEDKPPVAPWAVELKKTNRPQVPQTNGEDQADGSKTPVTVSPARRDSTGNKENAKPIIVSSKDVYVPSWLKKGQQTKNSPPSAAVTPSPTANGTEPSAKTSPGNPMKAYETPKWKLELAEKKKQRESKLKMYCV